jgi:hypothetical protein
MRSFVLGSLMRISLIRGCDCTKEKESTAQAVKLTLATDTGVGGVKLTRLAFEMRPTGGISPLRSEEMASEPARV